MKSIKKILFIMVALATALAFVSCSNGSDDGGSNNSNSNSNNSSNNNADNNNSSNNNGGGNNNTVAKPSVVATYESENGKLELTFFGDGEGAGTWSVIEYIQSNKITWAQGTFEGYPEKKSATIEFKWEKYYDEELGITKDVSAENLWERRQISNGELDFDYALNDNYVWFTRQ